MITRKLHHLLIAPADYLPKNIIHFGIRLLGFLWDNLDQLSGQRFDLLPHLAIRIEVNSNIRVSSYRKYGEFFLKYFKTVCKLNTSSRVLDVGCGSGILAAPLTKYLDKNGRYEGFDINERLIDWCMLHISSQYPNFCFQTVDVYNGKYNPNGKIIPTKFRFPYKSSYFDLVILSSVFTHMLPHDIEHYLSEISRVLKKNGKCVISYMLIDSSVDSLMKKKLSSVDFKYTFGNYRTINMPRNNATYEDIVGYDEAYIRDVYKKNGLRIDMPIHYGYWSGRERIPYLHKQDIIIATKY